MVRLKVIIVGTSPAETLRLEEALHQTGYLETFRYIGLEQAMERIPNWEDCDLLMARYQEQTAADMLSLFAPVLRKVQPPIVFLIDPYDPVLVTRLLNAGALRVLPMGNELEQVLEANLAGIFRAEQPLITRLAGITNHSGASAAQLLEKSGPVDTASQPEQRFLSTEEGFARLFRTSPMGISINRVRDGRCIDCNDSYARLLDAPREELIGSDAIELGIPGDIQDYFEVDPNAPPGQDQPSVLLDRKIYTRGRQIRHVQVHMDQVEWDGEKCILYLVQDITEQEQAKEKVRRLNDELERLVLVRTGALEAANRELAAEIGRRKVLEDFSNQLSQIIWETPDVISICAPDGTMQFLNKAGRALYGLDDNESVSHLDFISAYAEEIRASVREEVLPKLIRTGIWRGETAFHLPDGRIIPVSQVLLSKKDDNGQVQFFGSIARDISDFKHVEQELRQSRERYRTLAEAAHDFIFMVSRDGLMEYANEFACHTLGYQNEKVEGIPASQFFPKDFASNHLQTFEEVHEIDRPIYTEGPFTLEGQEYWLGTWLVPIHNDDGGLVSVLGISRDITEQKKTDEALQRALTNERRLGEMRSNFFSMTSHQFRTPLSTILLSAELLQKYGQRWDDLKRSEHLIRIQEAAKRLNSMLEDILIIGRTESGRYVCSPKEFDLIAYCDQAIREMTINDRGEHELSFAHNDAELTVYHDTEVMHRVVDNLLTNAIKYSPKGSQIEICVKSEGENILMEVSDQGIGIPERDLMYLFQPFQRGSNAGEIPGTGIGLTIIQKSVELMNGSISLKSKEGQGTTFMVRFPARYENKDNHSS